MSAPGAPMVATHTTYQLGNPSPDEWAISSFANPTSSSVRVWKEDPTLHCLIHSFQLICLCSLIITDCVL